MPTEGGLLGPSYYDLLFGTQAFQIVAHMRAMLGWDLFYDRVIEGVQS